MVPIKPIIDYLKNQPSSLQHVYIMFGTDDPIRDSKVFLIKSSAVKPVKVKICSVYDEYAGDGTGDTWDSVMFFAGEVKQTNEITINNLFLNKDKFITNCIWSMDMPYMSAYLGKKNPIYKEVKEFEKYKSEHPDIGVSTYCFETSNGKKACQYDTTCYNKTFNSSVCGYVTKGNFVVLSGQPYSTGNHKSPNNNFLCTIQGTCNSSDCCNNKFCNHQDGSNDIDGIWYKISLEDLQDYYEDGFDKLVIYFTEGGDKSSYWYKKICTPK